MGVFYPKFVSVYVQLIYDDMLTLQVHRKFHVAWIRNFIKNTSILDDNKTYFYAQICWTINTF